MSATTIWVPAMLRQFCRSAGPNRACLIFSSCSTRPAKPSSGLSPSRYSSTSSKASPTRGFDILFCGSDTFSIASLKALLGARETWRSLTVLVPQTKMGRSRRAMEPAPCALSDFAKANDISVENVPAGGIKAYEPPKAHMTPSPTSLLITASFGHLLPDAFLDRFLPTHALNVHPSLLPRWRGAAPIQWTIAKGDTFTGVTVQKLGKLKAGVDSGEVVGMRSGIPVPEKATYTSLLPVLADVGGAVLVEVVKAMQQGEVQGVGQDSSRITRAPKITEDIARFRDQTADALERLSRGISHQHPIWTTFEDQKIQLISISTSGPPFALASHAFNRKGLAVLDKKDRVFRLACAPGPPGQTYNPVLKIWERGEGPAWFREQQGNAITWLAVARVKPEGRRDMGAVEWWNGMPKHLRARQFIEMGAPRSIENSKQDPRRSKAV